MVSTLIKRKPFPSFWFELFSKRDVNCECSKQYYMRAPVHFYVGYKKKHSSMICCSVKFYHALFLDMHYSKGIKGLIDGINPFSEFNKQGIGILRPIASHPSGTIFTRAV